MNDSLAGKNRAIVLGLGRFGGGLGVTRALADAGLSVMVVDKLEADALAPAIESLSDLIETGQVEVIAGDDSLPACSGNDVIVVNPAVPQPWCDERLLHAEASGAMVTSEIELTFRALVDRLGEHADIIAVSGSSGKSTTTSMIGAGLMAAGRSVVVGGNIGGSLLGEIASMPRDAAVVLELSSAMLWWLERCEVFRPKVCVLTTYSKNHIDWHGSIEHYRQSKKGLMTAAQETAVLGEGVADWAVPRHVNRVVARSDQVEKDVLAVPGVHNRLNAAMAVEACAALGADRDLVSSGIGQFKGLAHRLCRLFEAGGVVWYDDSKSTTPESTLLAIRALRETSVQRIHLIAGGYDKGIDLRSIAQLGREIATLATIGATGELLAAEGGISCGTLERAVSVIHERIQQMRGTGAGPNGTVTDAVLLSPACASWDQFANFEERGHRFAQLASEVCGCDAW